MKTIPLTQGKVALLDDADFERLAQLKWFARRRQTSLGERWYALHTDNVTRRTLYLHREILGAPAGVDVDHRNGDGLDNRRENLRLARRAQNARNQMKRAGTSRFKGVSRNARSGRWYAAICANGVSRFIGSFSSEEEAARAYDKAAVETHREFARLNFPSSEGV